jgi:hypothetical protein
MSEERTILFKGIDYFGRAVFKDIKRKHYYCITNPLFRDDIEVKEYINNKENTNWELTFKGKDLEGEPEFDVYKEHFIITF